MDSWQVAQNYVVAAAIVGTVGGYYYYTSNQKKPNRTGSELSARRSATDLKARHDVKSRPDATPRQDSTSAARKRKVKPEVPRSKEEVVETPRDTKPAKESDMSTAQFAQQMLQARQGAKLSAGKSEKARAKTVKPRMLPVHSTEHSVAGAEVEEEEEHDLAEAPTHAGNVSDMLEPKAAAPTTLRITAPEKPQPQRAPRQLKEQGVESKKQRQNRKKVEERKVQREEEEKERRLLEERQRRTAREARGEPAKNGLASKPPSSNPWEQRDASSVISVQAAAPTSHGAALLDTFDAESTSSSNGVLEASTAATSTTEEPHHGTLSEEQQVAVALQQSVDESGWTTVAPVKKSARKTSNNNISAASKAPPQKQAGAYAALDHPSNNPSDWTA